MVTPKGLRPVKTSYYVCKVDLGEGSGMGVGVGVGEGEGEGGGEGEGEGDGEGKGEGGGEGEGEGGGEGEGEGGGEGEGEGIGKQESGGGSASQPILPLPLSQPHASDDLDSRRGRLLDWLQQPDHGLSLVAVLSGEPVEEGVLFIGREEVFEVPEQVAHGEWAVPDVLKTR